MCNIKLISELFVRGAINESIVQACVEKLFNEKTPQAAENLAILISRIGMSLYMAYAYQEGQTTLKKKPKIKVKALTKEIFDDYIDRLHNFMQLTDLSSRTKFML